MTNKQLVALFEDQDEYRVRHELQGEGLKLMIKERDRLQDAADAADRRVAALQESIDAITVTEVYNGVALRIYATPWLATNDRLIVGVAGEQRPHRTAEICGSPTRWVELIARDGEWIGGAAFEHESDALTYAKRWVTRGKK